MLDTLKSYQSRFFHFLEFIVKLVVPVSAVIVLSVRIINRQTLTTDVTLELILAIVAGLAISEGLSRFVTLETIKKKIESLHDYDIPNQKLLDIAHRSGIVSLSPRFNGEWHIDIANEIFKSKSTLDICGIALPSLMKEQKLKSIVLKHAEKYDVRVLLLNPSCPEAERRGNIEKPHETTISNIRSTVSWLTEQMSLNLRIEIRLYTLPPMLALFITEHFVFVEPYHFGKPKGIDTCIGGYVPLQKIKNNVTEDTEHNPYLFFKEHFQYMWNDSRSGRSYIPFETVEFVADSHIAMKNANHSDIAMSGWTMAVQNSQPDTELQLPGFGFQSDFVWKKGGTHTIHFSKRSKISSADVWDIKLLRPQSILTMSNSNGVIVSQWSPIPLDAQTRQCSPTAPADDC